MTRGFKMGSGQVTPGPGVHEIRNTLQQRLHRCETNLRTVAYTYLKQQGYNTQELASRLFPPARQN